MSARDRGGPCGVPACGVEGRHVVARERPAGHRPSERSVDADTTKITTDNLGSVLSGGGSVPTPNTPAGVGGHGRPLPARGAATRLHIPLLYGIDTVHGDGNMFGATVFPHNIGLGATRDPALVRDVEHIAAEETRATGPQWAFAPCICAARDDRWGRTYESFGEDPRLVEQMETAIDGFQGPPGQLDRPRPRARDREALRRRRRHHVRHRATGDYTIDQGVDRSPTATTSGPARAAPVRPRVQQHHVGSVMPSYSSVDWTEDGLGNPIKMHANQELITGRGSRAAMGFDGFVITDYDGIDHITQPGDLRRRRSHRRQRRHRHVHGAQRTSSSFETHADRRGQRRPRADEPDRRRRQPHPDQEVRARPVRAPVHRPHATSTRSARRRTARSPAGPSPSRRCC